MARFMPAMFVMLALLFGCKTNMKPSEEGRRDAARKVLIAAEESAFKTKVVAGLIAELGPEGWYFRVIGLDQIAGVETKEYGAIVLLGGYRAGRLDERVTRFVGKDPTNPKLIVFYTRGTEDPMPARKKPNLRVDSLSSASRNERVTLRASELAELVRRRF